MWAIASLTVAYGFYRVGQGNKKRNGEKLEERTARYAMAPVLQAEEDRWYANREKEIMKREAEIMKNVPGYVIWYRVVAYKIDWRRNASGVSILSLLRYATFIYLSLQVEGWRIDVLF